jgi:uncharacterized membrane protein YdjX (TVP38/TMEM64 family)
LRLIVAAAAVGLLVLAGFLLPVQDWTVTLATSARGAGATGAVLFFVAYVVATVAMWPGSLLTLAIGFAYGPVWGLLLASPASVTAATAAFLLGRSVLRDRVQRRVQASRAARAIEQAVGREAFKLVLLLRLSPLVPFNLLNYALSLSRVRLGTYVLASFIGMLPGTALYVYLGSLATAAAELSSARSAGGSLKTTFYVGGLVATGLVVFFTTRAARRALATELPERAS